MTTATAPARYQGFAAMPVAGRWRPGSSGKTGADLDPWSGDTLTEIPLASAGDLDEAFRAASEAQPQWAAQPPAARAGVMRAAADVMTARKEEVTSWLVRESGGTVAKAELEWSLVRSVLWEASSMPHHVTGSIRPSDIPGKESRVYRQPAGVAAVISPWNFPLQLSNRSVAPALATGNAVVLKPASDTPVTGGLLLAKIYQEAGLPPGVLSVVAGSGSEIGDAIVSHPAARVVSFTGSTAVGEGIARQAGIRKLALELGGNGPLVVLDDADLDRAVDAAVFGSFFHQGQICMIANRIIVDSTVYDEFTERFVQRVSGLQAGDPSDAATDIGPVITVIRAEGEEDALRIANDTEYGLSSAVFTRDADRGVRFALRIEAGMTHVNDSPVNDDANTAFGGSKASGIGRFGGPWAVEEFTTDHWVSVQHEPRSFPI